MIYINRALHFFLKMVVILTAAFGIMYLMGWLDVEQGQFTYALLNTPKGWAVMGLIVAISLAYPLLSFSKTAIRSDADCEMAVMDEVISRIGYVRVKQDEGHAEYRAQSFGKRVFNQFDDRITVERDGSYITVSGLKKDVLRIESLFMQYRLKEE